MKEDIYNRLKQLNKGHLAEHLVRGRDLAERSGEGSGSGLAGGKESKKPAGSPEPTGRRERKRPTDDMVREAESGREGSRPRRRRGVIEGLGRLAGLRRVGPAESPGDATSSGVPQLNEASGAFAQAWEHLKEEIEGELRRTAEGACLVRVEMFPEGAWCGCLRIPQASSMHPEILARLSRDDDFAALRPSEILFLDTETTGLAGGTGTVAFLVGAAAWDEGGFRVVQYFMPDFPEEGALLRLFEEDLGRFSALVTFNGKAFDIPLLSSRLVRSRRGAASRLAGLPHLDLLHPARRLWKQRLRDCSLVNLEREVLGFEREEDIAGWEIPQVYFRFLTEGEPGLLPTVFLHNRYDLVTLAHLSARTCQLYREPLGDPSLPGIDLYSLGRSLELDGEANVALEVFEEARLGDLDSEMRRRVLRHLSRAYKRQENWEAAVAIWQELGEAEGVLEVFSFEEMAKFYEHVAGDLQLAAAVTSRILEALSGTGCVDPTPYSDPAAAAAALSHRLRRIERKLVRSQET